VVTASNFPCVDEYVCVYVLYMVGSQVMGAVRWVLRCGWEKGFGRCWHCGTFLSHWLRHVFVVTRCCVF